MKSRQNEAVMPLRSAPEKTLCGCENFHVEFFAFLAVGREVEKTDICRRGEYFLS